MDRGQPAHRGRGECRDPRRRPVARVLPSRFDPLWVPAQPARPGPRLRDPLRRYAGRSGVTVSSADRRRRRGAQPREQVVRGAAAAGHAAPGPDLPPGCRPARSTPLRADQCPLVPAGRARRTLPPVRAEPVLSGQRAIGQLPARNAPSRRSPDNRRRRRNGRSDRTPPRCSRRSRARRGNVRRTSTRRGSSDAGCAAGRWLPRGAPRSLSRHLLGYRSADVRTTPCRRDRHRRRPTHSLHRALPAGVKRLPDRDVEAARRRRARRAGIRRATDRNE